MTIAMAFGGVFCFLCIGLSITASAIDHPLLDVAFLVCAVLFIASMVACLILDNKQKQTPKAKPPYLFLFLLLFSHVLAWIFEGLAEHTENTVFFVIHMIFRFLSLVIIPFGLFPKKKNKEEKPV